MGTAQLLEPRSEAKGRGRTDFIGCLFTRVRPGQPPRGVTAEQDRHSTLENTRKAMEDLLAQITELEKKGTEVGDIVMPMINAGLFKVPWARTAEALTGVLDKTGSERHTTVYEP